MAVYQDFADLVDNLYRHVVATGRMPLCADQPARRQLGWYDVETGETWHADITAVKRWQSDLRDDQLQKVARDLMATHEGRQRFAAYLLHKAQEERATAASEPDAPTFWDRLLDPETVPS